MHSYSVDSYGAVGDGKTINTAAIQAAVDACAEAGGGRVVVPAGVFVSSSIFLRSNVEFHLTPGAMLQGSPDLADHPLLDIEGHGYHCREWIHAALLTACACGNVSITGTGTIDGSGHVWWEAKNRTSEEQAAVRKDGPLKGWRPPLLFFFDCTRIKVRDVKLQNSPMYGVLPVCCRDVVIDGVTIESPWMPYNNCDGIDIMSCKDVRVSNCHVDTGDDGICLKTLPGWYLFYYGPDDSGEPGQDLNKPRLPCENILVENCVIRRAHTGVSVWAEVSGGMSNVVVNNCVFDGTRTGIQIARWSWPDGYVSDCSFTNIVMRRVETGIIISNQTAPWETQREGPTPRFHNIRIAHVTGTKLSVAGKLHGTEDTPIHDIDLSDFRIESDLGFQMSWAQDIRMAEVNITCRNVPLVMRDCTNVEAVAFNAHPSTDAIPIIEVERGREIWIHGCTAAPGTGTFLGEVGQENEVQLEHNRLHHAAAERGPVEPDNRWNTCSHAFTGSRWIRETGEHNIWLPMPTAVDAFVRDRWTPQQVDGIYSVSRVEANARSGAHADFKTRDGGMANIEGRELRRIYIIESRHTDERLVVFEDGELLRTVEDPDFHAHID